jgi:hypothetical protein
VEENHQSLSPAVETHQNPTDKTDRSPLAADTLADAAEVERLMAPTGPGFVTLTIGALAGARVLLVRELPPPAEAEIPPEAAALPRYTLPELERLGGGGPVDGASALRVLHELRRIAPTAGWGVAPPPEAKGVPAACGWCGGALAPFPVDLAGRPALLCPACHRWTYTARAT